MQNASPIPKLQKCDFPIEHCSQCHLQSLSPAPAPPKPLPFPANLKAPGLCFPSIIIFPTRMSNKANMMNQEYRDWILNERTKIVHAQNKVILPRLANDDGAEHPHARRSLRKRDDDATARNLKDSNVPDSGRYKHKGETRVETSRTVHSRQAAARDPAQMRQQKAEVMREMKSWIKLVEAAGREGREGEGEGEISLPKLEGALYKWCLFIEENFACYERQDYALPTPYDTPILKPNKNPEEHAKLPAREDTFKEQRDIYEKEIRRLSMRIQETEEEIEANRVNNQQSLARICDLERLFFEWSEKVRMESAKEAEEAKAVDSLLLKNEQFLVDLKDTLAKSKQTAALVQKIDEKLRHFHQYKHEWNAKLHS